MRVLVAAVAAALFACAAPGTGGGGAPTGKDLAHGDGPPAATDLFVPADLRCALGTPDHCRACDDVCPGKDDAGTARICLGDGGGCSLLCKGEYYDLDGDVKTGC